ncbi:hypothetical protein [Paenarthrobacter nitroguajacolicus]|nr:hypothetical protein [Paenarthrobacter nitroguajacolicus]
MDRTHSGMGSSVTPSGLLAALTHIDTVGFHGIATVLTGAEPKIDPIWAP